MPARIVDWRRKFLQAEHEKRSWAVAKRRREYNLLKQISDLTETAEMLHAQLRLRRHELRSHMRAIRIMKDTLDANQITDACPVVMSMRLCRAADDGEETCPLAMEPINTETLPFEGCCPLLDPLKPDDKCAQLMCGHRFNAVWLMYHFVRNSTFRCPVCRQGRRRFTFEEGVVPECMVKKARARSA
jgi:hypothetical protein